MRKMRTPRQPLAGAEHKKSRHWAAPRSTAGKSSGWCLLVFGPTRERTVNQHVSKIRISPLDTHGFVIKRCVSCSGRQLGCGSFSQGCF